VHTKIKLSALPAVVVRVGADHPARLIVVNHVTVRDHVQSCWILRLNICHIEAFDNTMVLFPAIVTVNIFAVARSAVTVAQSVSATTHSIDALTVGLVSVLPANVWI
jgi:hypothetical protein